MLIPIRRTTSMGLAFAAAVGLPPPAAGAQTPGTPPADEPSPVVRPLTGEAAEQFLREAKVVDREGLPVGVTRPLRLTLTDGTRTARAVWKTVSEYAPIKRFPDGGPPEVGFRDDWKGEIAAYQLDRLLGLGIVPPTVQRRWRGERGSLQLWLDDCMTEGERRTKDIRPDDVAGFTAQTYVVRMFHQLIYDADYQNLSNILVCPEFTLWSVDHSRAFRTQKTLQRVDYLRRFDPTHAAVLRSLDPPVLKRHLGPWLSKGQRASLLERRDLLLEHFARLEAEHGPAAFID